MRIGLIALGVNFVLSVSLAWYLTRIGFAGSHAGLALAISVAALLNALLLYLGLRRDGVIRHATGWSWLLIRVLIANSTMWLVLEQLQRPGAWWLDVAHLDRIGWLSVSIGAGAMAYFAALLVLGMRLRDFHLRRA